ncbi:MAG: ribbon-helix-helix protein, CopG family [Gemmatimonadetes bacterium]|nr:ribbon-helix-helix protein, CopG family [Gemmatimonadota bacterium]MYC00047.1 ribbon-helix-helix protein, CopG family [Gemmatimonadota bacterium]MYH51512.1 ribbon-helix-helix protein, CopG family [Gemmatimonadota bacterium]MYK65070.1 ribbon-helix-helix protein, CopG family [Gemmatimonadota bacterium]
MSTFSFKMPEDMYGALAAEAKRRNVTRSALIREMIDQALQYNDCAAPPSCAQLAGDLVGVLRSGRRDLGTHERLLEEAMITDARRNAPDRRR